MHISLFKKRKISGKLVKIPHRPDFSPPPPPPSYSIYYISVHRLEVLHGASFVCLFVLFVCLFGIFRPTPEFFIHMETLPTMLGTRGHRAVMVL